MTGDQVLTPNGISLFIFLIPILGAFLLMAVLVIWQRMKIKKLEEQTKPKFGFLGKRLAAFAMIAAVGGVMAVGLYNSNPGTGVVDVSVDDSDTSKIRLDLVYEVKSEKETRYVVDLALTPFVGGVAWGEEDADFDIFWLIEGEVTADVSELAKNRLDPSQIEVELPAGIYTVTVDVFADSNSSQLVRVIEVP